MSSLSQLRNLHDRGDVEFWLSKELGHPKNRQLVRAICRAEPPSLVRDTVWIVEGLAKIAWIAATVYLAFSDRPWYWAVLSFIGGLYALYILSKRQVHKRLINSLLANEEVLDAMWADDLVSLFGTRSKSPIARRRPTGGAP